MGRLPHAKLHRLVRYARICATFALAPIAANAQQPNPGLDPIWDLTTPDNPRHWFTGVACGGPLVGVAFSGRGADQPNGNDVNCRWGGPYDSAHITMHLLLRAQTVDRTDRHFDMTRQIVERRYPSARRTEGGIRRLASRNGELRVHEQTYVLAGRDAFDGSSAQGVSGIWIADVAGWDVKVRVTLRDGDVARARALADAALLRAANGADVARTCNTTPGPSPVSARRSRRSAEDATAQDVAAGSLIAGLLLSAATPPGDASSARLAGYVCLETTQDYPARVLRRSPAAPPSEPLASTNVDIAYRGEPLGAGPTVWFVLAPEMIEEAENGRSAEGTTLHMISIENGAAALYGTAADRLSLPGLTVAIARGAIPVLATISVDANAPSTSPGQ